MNQGLIISTIVGIFLVVCVLFESLIITAFRVNRFLPALLHAAIANVVSLLAIYFLWPFISKLDLDEDKVFPLLPLLMLVTLIVEALLLKLLNRQQRWLRIFLTSTVMNSVSFFVLYGLLTLL